MSQGECTYMPHAEGTIRGKGERLFRKFAYRVWKGELNRYRRRTARSALRVVDVGCGPGFLLQCLGDWFPTFELMGVDANERLLDVMRSRCKTAQGVKGDASSLPLENVSCDVVFAFHVIEHMKDPARLLAEARRILRPDGLLVIATPNAQGLAARLLKRRWVGFSDPTHISLYGPSFWRGLVQEAGFSIQHDGTTGLSGIPLFNRVPLGLIHWIPSFFCGHYPWDLGEAYICVALKVA